MNKMTYYQVFLDATCGQERLLATVWANSCQAACDIVRDKQKLSRYDELFTIEYYKRNNHNVMAEYPDR